MVGSSSGASWPAAPPLVVATVAASPDGGSVAGASVRAEPRSSPSPPMRGSLPQLVALDQLVEVAAVDPGGLRGGGDRVVRSREQIGDVVALEVLDRVTPRLLVRQRAGGGRRDERRQARLVEDEAALDVVAQLAHVAGPRRAGERREEAGLVDQRARL